MKGISYLTETEKLIINGGDGPSNPAYSFGYWIGSGSSCNPLPLCPYYYLDCGGLNQNIPHQ